jgi:hypothetical protein
VKTITILTPTYNRGGLIEQLYASLEAQTDKDFEWLIVDDGSVDNTRSVVKRMQEVAEFPICYIYKENGGKHTALNVGIRVIQSELTFVVDSDDFLAPNAVETIFRYHRRYKNEPNLCGYSFLRAFPDGKVNGKEFKQNEWIVSYIEARINTDDTKSDKAEVFFTQCLKEFPFSEYTDEKFLGEDIVWIRMARKYNMVHINEAIYIGNYQADGLTKNRRKNNINSPVGCMHRAEEYMCKDIKMKYRIKGNLQFVIYGLFSHYSPAGLFKKSRDKLLTFICMIPGIIIKLKWS